MVFRQILFGLCFFSTSLIYAQVWDFKGVDFAKADKVAQKNYGASLDNLPLLANNLTVGLETDAQRFRSIYYWVCHNIKNDYNLYNKNKRKRKRYEEDSVKLEKWNDRFKKKVFSTLLKRKRTICTGYAYMVKTLCDLADLECRMVDGFGKTAITTLSQLTSPNHSWNAVKLNGKWYLSDPTWASGTQNPKNERFEFNYNDGLFLVNPELFALSHYPINPDWLLIKENAPSFQDFVDAPIIYGETYQLLSKHKSPQQFYHEVAKDYVLKINLSKRPDTKAENFVLAIDNGVNTTTATPDIETNGDEILLNYTFKKYGYFDVHLMIVNKTVATYIYYVKRNVEEK